ncbi:MAG TPA: peptide chain release factor 1 [Thermomicrobiales bacterium]|jgi:peptide chain release factor 1
MTVQTAPMYERLAAIEARFEELEHLMGLPETSTQPTKLADYGRERSEIEEVVGAYRHLKGIESQISEAELMAGDSSGDREMAELAEAELEELRPARDATLEQIRMLLVPKDPNDDKNVIVEIRAGAGGDEAALFAGELFRMYQKYADKQRWKTDILSLSEIGIGGVKEAVFEVRGKGAYSHLRFESGVHRVQRVPETESSGRIHTSTVTVVVLPEAEEVDVKIEDNDLRIDVYRSGGNGGQSVNTTDSAVRLTHLPTGMVVTCQDEKSQLKNKLKAMTVLRSRLYDVEQQRLAQERGDARRSQVGSGDRSEKIRTYNFPQDRVTDHRIKINLSNLPNVMQGEIEPFIHELRLVDQADRLRHAGLN